MRRFLYIWTIVVLIFALAACGRKKPTDGVIPNDYKVTLIADASNPHRLIFDLKETESGAQATSSGREIHVLVLPPDLSTLYHDHPVEVRDGRYHLVVDYLPSDGVYDVWLEVTVGSDHHNAFLQRFRVQLPAGSGQAPSPQSPRMALTTTPSDVATAGRPSKVTFGLALDGKPPAKYGQYRNVAVHAFAVSKNRDFLVHDHAETQANGLVNATFTFPKSGEYVIFLQPTVIADEIHLTHMLRHEVSVR